MGYLLQQPRANRWKESNKHSMDAVGPPLFRTEPPSPSSSPGNAPVWLLPKVRDQHRQHLLHAQHPVLSPCPSGWPRCVQLTPGIVPDTVVCELHGVRVLCLLEVLVGVAAHVAPAADVPADQTDPQVLQHKGHLWGAALGGSSTPRQSEPRSDPVTPSGVSSVRFPTPPPLGRPTEGGPCPSNPTQMREWPWLRNEGSQQALEGTDWKGHHQQAGLGPCCHTDLSKNHRDSSEQETCEVTSLPSTDATQKES